MLTVVSAAQAQIGVQVGGGLIYGTEAEELGFNVRGTVRFGNFRVAPGLDYFFVEQVDGFKTRLYSINIDGNYVFDLPGGIVSPYVLLGLNFTTGSFEEENSGIKISNTETGVNIGGGVDFNLKVINPFAEVKYVIGDADQVVFAAGIKFGFGSK